MIVDKSDFSFDADDAGIKAAKRSAEIAISWNGC